jgi:hypothetical protein
MLISGEGLRYSPAELQFYTSLASLLASLPLSLFLFNWDKVLHCLCKSILSSVGYRNLFCRSRMIYSRSGLSENIPVTIPTGTGSRDRIQIFGRKKSTVLVINKEPWFWNFQNVPLMRCRHCHLGENLLENNIYWRNIY